MLKYIRKKHKEILWLLVIVIVPGFTLWGISSVIRRQARGPSYAGTVFGRKISFEQFQENKTAVTNQAIMTYGYDQLKQIARYLDFDQQAWQRLTMLQEARKKNIRVTNQEVIDYIAALPFFQTEGNFDPELYKARLKLLFYNTPAHIFEKQVREFLTLTKLHELITGTVQVSDEEIRQAYATDNEKVKIRFVMFPAANYKEKIALDEKQINEFYAEKKADYKKPDQVNVKYICVLSDSFVPEAKKEITEEEVQDYYENNKERFLIVSPGSNTDEKQAEKKEKQYQPVEQVREQILDALSAQEAAALAKKKMETVYNDLIELNSLEKTAQKYSLEIKQTGFFTMQQQIPDIGFSKEFIEEAFKRPIGEYSDLIQTAKGCYVIQPLEKKQAYIPELNEVLEQVKDDLIKKEAATLAQATAQAAKEKIAEMSAQGEAASFKEIAGKLSLDVKEPEFVSRNDYIPEIGPCRDVKEIFEGELNKIGPVVETKKGYLLFIPVEKQPFDETKFTEEEKNSYRQRLLSQKKGAVYSEWLKDLNLRADLRSNLDQVRNTEE